MAWIQLIPASTQSGGRRVTVPTAKLTEGGLLILNPVTVGMLGTPAKLLVYIDIDRLGIKLQPSKPDDAGAFTLSAGGQASARVYLRKLVSEHPEMIGTYTVRSQAHAIVLTRERS